jgi:hypothetical protein
VGTFQQVLLLLLLLQIVPTISMQQTASGCPFANRGLTLDMCHFAPYRNESGIDYQEGLELFTIAPRATMFFEVRFSDKCLAHWLITQRQQRALALQLVSLSFEEAMPLHAARSVAGVTSNAQPVCSRLFQPSPLI